MTIVDELNGMRGYELYPQLAVYFGASRWMKYFFLVLYLFFPMTSYAEENSCNAYFREISKYILLNKSNAQWTKNGATSIVRLGLDSKNLSPTEFQHLVNATFDLGKKLHFIRDSSQDEHFSVMEIQQMLKNFLSSHLISEENLEHFTFNLAKIISQKDIKKTRYLGVGRVVYRAYSQVPDRTFKLQGHDKLMLEIFIENVQDLRVEKLVLAMQMKFRITLHKLADRLEQRFNQSLQGSLSSTKSPKKVKNALESEEAQEVLNFVPATIRHNFEEWFLALGPIEQKKILGAIEKKVRIIYKKNAPNKDLPSKEDEHIEKFSELRAKTALSRISIFYLEKNGALMILAYGYSQNRKQLLKNAAKNYVDIHENK